jgi:hypothetical protein
MSGAVPLLLLLYTFKLWTGTACMCVCLTVVSCSEALYFEAHAKQCKKRLLHCCSIAVGDSDSFFELIKWIGIFCFACFNAFLAC